MMLLRVLLAGLLLTAFAGCGGEVPRPHPDAVSGTPPASAPTTPAARPTTPSVPGTAAPAENSEPAGPTATKSPPTRTDPASSAATTNTAETSARPDPRPEPPFTLEPEFTLLTFSDFEAFGAEADTWQGTPEGLRSSGKPRGYLYSKQSYDNFTLRLDYRFPRPASLKDDAKFKGNTGFLVYVTGEPKLWPVCLEVQGKYVQMAAIKENGGAQPVTATDDETQRQKARRPVGEWNSLEIVSRGGALQVSLNGAPISTCEPDFLSEGLLGIQAEDHPFEVRRMRVRRD